MATRKRKAPTATVDVDTAFSVQCTALAFRDSKVSMRYWLRIDLKEPLVVTAAKADKAKDGE